MVAIKLGDSVVEVDSATLVEEINNEHGVQLVIEGWQSERPCRIVTGPMDPVMAKDFIKKLAECNAATR